MRRFGADTANIDRLIARLRAGEPLAEAMARAELAEPMRRFVGHTFAVIEQRRFVPRLPRRLPSAARICFPTCSAGLSIGCGGESQAVWTISSSISSGTSSWMATSMAPWPPDWSSTLCGSDAARWQAAEERGGWRAWKPACEFWDAIHGGDPRGR